MRKLLIIAAVSAVLILAGCSKAEESTPPEQTAGVETEADAVTTASIVNTEAAFRTAVSDEGSWIIAILEGYEFH